MNIIEEIKNLELIIKESKSLPGTSKVMMDKTKSLEIIKGIITSLPSEFDEAGMITRQKEAIIDQADKEAVRIRNYADEESSTVREIAKRDAAGIISEAEEKAEKMLLETSIIEAANKRSEEIILDAQSQSENLISSAQHESNRLLEESEKISIDRRDGADNYAKEVLYALEERISTILGQVRSGLDLLDEPAENVVAEEK
jgi:cell division septum initiation protein DivIVA|tara:strand:- start:3967 stop:4569 length:603 start_codon:yes stop_codon:yes gene_type:complete